jgi:NitT/TauT family transport system ATP-binding protein
LRTTAVRVPFADASIVLRGVQDDRREAALAVRPRRRRGGSSGLWRPPKLGWTFIANASMSWGANAPHGPPERSDADGRRRDGPEATGGLGGPRPGRREEDEVDRIETPDVGSISTPPGRDALAPVANRPTMNDVPTSELTARVTSRRGFARIRIEHLGISYDTPNGRLIAMEDISFNIEGGEILCLVGPSGCGKSSLLNALSGFIAPAQGRIEVDGCEVGWTGLRRGVVFQEYALFPWRTARRNIEFGLEVRGLPVKERREIAQRALEQVGLTDFAEFYPHRLSGGMRQRVAVARALAFDPDLMLMDEPFAALDEEMREELQRLVIKLWRETRKTFVYVTHSVQEAVYLADRVIVLTRNPTRVRGVITVDLPRPRDRLADEFHAYVKALVRLIRQHN